MKTATATTTTTIRRPRRLVSSSSSTSHHHNSFLGWNSHHHVHFSIFSVFLLLLLGITLLMTLFLSWTSRSFRTKIHTNYDDHINNYNNKEYKQHVSQLSTQEYSDLAQWNLDVHFNQPTSNLILLQNKNYHPVSIPVGYTFTVLIVSPCEYNHHHTYEGCNYLGRQRSMYFASLFGTTNTSRWPKPSQLYALEDYYNNEDENDNGENQDDSRNIHPNTTFLRRFFSKYNENNKNRESKTTRRDIQMLLPLAQSLQEKEQDIKYLNMSTMVSQTTTTASHSNSYFSFLHSNHKNHVSSLWNQDNNTNTSSIILSVNHPTQLAQEIYQSILSSFIKEKNTNHPVEQQKQAVFVVVVSNINDFPHVALELGCGPYNAGCPRYFDGTINSKYDTTDTTNNNNNHHEYDTIWELTFVYESKIPQEQELTTTSSSTLNKKTFNILPQWFVYGSILSQNFDPLQYSSQVLGLYTTMNP